jgi:hypothetical protein
MQFPLSRRMLMTFSLCCMLANPARASNDGDLCNGLAMLICMPVFLTAVLVHQLTPATPSDQMSTAITKGDLDKVKQLLKKTDTFHADKVLREAANDYIHLQDQNKDTARFSILQYLVDEVGVDLSGSLGTELQQMTVDSTTFEFQPLENAWKKRLQLARLVIAHGASAQNVKIGYCRHCEHDQELLPLLIKHGANPNGAERIMSGPLLVGFINQDQFDAAERLIRLGADPNGADLNHSDTRRQSMLFRMVSECDLPHMRRIWPAEKADADWQQCVEHATARISFAVAHGADPNGQATMENNCDCMTPYDLAQKIQNEPLAQTLLKLGASPDYAARCKRAAAVPTAKHS